MCQDEEEYKRFKCEGFGRAFHTTQRNYSHCMTGSETEPIHPHFQSVLTGTKQCSLQMPVSEVQQDMTEAKSLIITTGKEDGNSSKSKHSYKFAKIFKDSQKNLKIPYKQINEEQANKTDGLINSNASSVYTSHPTIPEYVDLDDFELGIICNRNDHRYSISMSSALSGSPSTVTVQEGDGSVEENENLIESLLEESIISNREVMESFGTGVESRAVSQASSSIAPKTVVESSSFLTPLPLLRSTEIVDDSLPLEDIQPSVKLDGKERIMLNQIQIDETDPSAFADILNNGIIDKVTRSSLYLKESVHTDTIIPPLNATGADRLINMFNNEVVESNTVASLNTFTEPLEINNGISLLLSDANSQSSREKNNQFFVSTTTSRKCDNCECCQKPLSSLGQLLEDNDFTPTSPISFPTVDTSPPFKIHHL